MSSTTNPPSYDSLPLSPYHLSTIGIASVFASIESHHNSLDPAEVSARQNDTVPQDKNYDSPIITRLHEIIGVLKSCPEDFVVREIGGVDSRTSSTSGDSKERGKGGIIADLTDTFKLPSNEVMDNIPEQQKNDTMSTDMLMSQQCTSSSDDSGGDGIVTGPSVPIVHADTPQDAIKHILTRCIQHVNRNSQESSCQGLELYQKLEKLSDNAMLLLQQDGDPERVSKDDGPCQGRHESIILPPIIDVDMIVRYQPVDTDDDITSTALNNKKKDVAQNRCVFHRALKIAFPILKSSTLSAQEGSDGKDRIVKVEMDDTFLDLVPYLLYPQRDIPSLYEFRNMGCPETTTSNPKPVHGRKERKTRKRCHDEDLNSRNDDMPHQKEQSSTVHEIHLYLKPTIERVDRKKIHHLIAKSCRDFETGTKNDVGYDEQDKDKRTTIIIVKWSKHALKTSMIRRQKRQKVAKDNRVDNFGHTMCILKKRRQEHSTMISLLASALNCRQSDIGLAGRKDTMAVTYQYCTLRYMSPFRVRKANDFLKEKGIELGNFQIVSWLLNPGDLQGNYFEIIIRNVKRVEKVFDDDSQDDLIQERLVPCESRYIESAVERVRQGGFINFFGEQRVGEAGPHDQVGVRSSDVGHAMLQGDFSGAIDLLMKGRYKSRAGDFVESEEVRHMRATYFETGNVDKTLSAMPRSLYLGRERTLLQGLKRYGRDKPLEVLKCLNFSTRMFYINAYQALVWNKMASERMKRYGIKPVTGDLYMEDSSNEVKVVVDEEAIHIKQVVLPLPGYNVLYPQNIIGDLYRDTMNQDGVIFDKHVVPEATGKGSYRFLVAYSEFLQWENVNQSEQLTDVKFKFSLSSGSFATMCLREIMATTVLRAPEERAEDISQ